MDLRDVMTKDVASVQKNTPIDEAARLMKQYNVGSIPVCEGDRVVGILTDRDIVLRNVANEGDKSSTTCGEVMTSNLVVGNVNMDVHEAARIMSDNQIRRLPIVENEKLVGMVALGDLAVEPNLVNEAGDALNDISKPSNGPQI
jgi:FOG: CBS domain